jgi:glycosyltransferase involved in cell wall biosynthesis
LRTWALLRALAEDDHQVTLVAFAEPGDLAAGLTPLRAVCAAVEPVAAPRADGRDIPGRLAALISPAPYGPRKFRSRAMARALSRRLAEERFDLLVCGGVYNVPNLPRPASIPVLLDKDDLNFVIYERWLRHEPGLLRRAYGALELAKMRRWEIGVCRVARALLAASEVEQAFLARLCPQVPTFVVPNVVDTEHYVPWPEAEGARPVVLYQGAMDWHPNRDAVAFFVEQILPSLRRRVPDVVFRIAGRRMPEGLRRRLADEPGVEVAGTVPDMRVEIARATVCAVPLRIGSGTRIKILEAAAMGKAIVSTSLGAEGLSLEDGEEIVIADTPAAFADAVAALLGDPARRERLGRAARWRVEKQYGFAAHQAALRVALEGFRR